MNYLTSALYIIGPISIGVMAALLLVMGRRLGQALELPPYYRLYYVSIFFFLLPLPVVWILLVTKAWGLPNPDTQAGLVLKLLVASIPLTIAVTFVVWATAKYWGWIWGELGSSRGGDGGEDEA